MSHRIVEERHLDDLAGLQLLIMPRIIVLDESAERTLEEWVRSGGMLVCESETGAFDAAGLYRYPADRWIARLTGAIEIGRRSLGSGPVRVAVPGSAPVDLSGATWCTPMRTVGAVWAADEEGALIQEVAVGSGRVLLCGTFLGTPPEGQRDGFAAFVEALVEHAGVAAAARFIAPEPAAEDFPFCRLGRAADSDVLFCFTPPGAGEVRLRLREDVFAGGHARDLLTGRGVRIVAREAVYQPDPWGIAVLAETRGAT